MSELLEMPEYVLIQLARLDCNKFAVSFADCIANMIKDVHKQT